MLSGGFENTFLCSSGAMDECSGRSHSDEWPPNWREAASLSTSIFISATPCHKANVKSDVKIN